MTKAWTFVISALLLISSTNSSKTAGAIFTKAVNCTQTQYSISTYTVPIVTQHLTSVVTKYSTTTYLKYPTTISKTLHTTSVGVVVLTNVITKTEHSPSQTKTNTVCKATSTPSNYPNQTFTTCVKTFSTNLVFANTAAVKVRTTTIYNATSTRTNGIKSVFASTVTSYVGEDFNGQAYYTITTSTLTTTLYGYTTTVKLQPTATPTQFRLQAYPDRYAYEVILDDQADNVKISCLSWNGTIDQSLTFQLVEGSLVATDSNTACQHGLEYTYDSGKYDENGIEIVSCPIPGSGTFPTESGLTDFRSCSIDCFGYLNCFNAGYTTWYAWDYIGAASDTDFAGCVSLGMMQDPTVDPKATMKFKVLPV